MNRKISLFNSTFRTHPLVVHANGPSWKKHDLWRQLRESIFASTPTSRQSTSQNDLTLVTWNTKPRATLDELRVNPKAPGLLETCLDYQGVDYKVLGSDWAGKWAGRTKIELLL